MENWLSREYLLIGEEKVNLIKNTKIAVLGLGGVGGACCEGLIRAGVSNLMIIDHDTIDISNLNRQIIATTENVGKSKCEAAKARYLSINPNANITAVPSFYLPENCDFLYEYQPDFIIDCIDTVTAKIHLAKSCKEKNIPLLMCLGTGNRLDPTKLQIDDISKTSGCPLARVLRRELKKQGITKQTVLFSTEPPYKACVSENSPQGRHSPGSMSFVPPVAGYILASYVIRKIIGLN